MNQKLPTKTCCCSLSIMLCLAAAVLLTFSPAVEAASPALGSIMPRGAQRGTELEINFHGERLKDAQEILFYSTGIETLELKVENDKHVKVRVKIAADCKLGAHAMRLRTATGITDLRDFFVGTLPVVAEIENNSEFGTPQPIAMNVTVDGVVQNEDVDYYIVEAKKGDRLAAEIEGIRLGLTLFDPYIAIMNMARFELAAIDDSALLKQDASCSIIVPEDGQYVIQVRESSYGGNGSCRYRLHVGHFPRPLVVYPAGGKVGEALVARLIGDASGDIEQSIPLPAETHEKYAFFAEQNGIMAQSPNYLRVSTFDNVLEAEPNGNRNKNATTTALTPPLALNGIIAEDGDEDWFKFQGKKGQALDFRVHARSLGSPLDAVVNLFAPDGKHLQGNDDSGGPDSYFRFTLPDDGEYQFRVRDHLQKGGADFIYRVEITPVEPGINVTFPIYERRTQQRQHIAVPRGNYYATMLRTARRDFGGDLVVEGIDLPQGMTMQVHPVPGNLSDALVVFHAVADAPVGGKLSDLRVRHADESKAIASTYAQDITLVYGPPNDTVFYGTQVDRMAAAVTEEAPFSIAIVQPKVPIVRNGTMQLKVVATRKEGFDAPITLRMPFRPPGIGAANTVQIPKGQNEALYTINANGNAQIAKWNIVITGDANSGYGQVWVSTPFAELEVAEPYVSMAIDMAAAEQGKPAAILCKLTQLKPFEGKAQVKLFGLPAKVTLKNPEVEISKDDKEVIYQIDVDAASPKGQHKSLFCQVVVTLNGEPILHSVGSGGILRIDAPPPPPKEAPKQVEKPKEEPKPAIAAPPKPLSRLEKLRIEQEKRQKGE